MHKSIAIFCLLLVACVGTPGLSPSPAPSAPPDARVLAHASAFQGGQPFSVAVATTPNELTALWSGLQAGPAEPSVDFSREVVFFLGMSGSSSCPEQFERIVVDEPNGHVYAEWAAHPAKEICTDDLRAQGVLIAVSRSVLPSETFLFSLREALSCTGCNDHPDWIEVSLAQDV